MNLLRMSWILTGLSVMFVVMSREPGAFGAGDPDRVTALENRVTSLEKVIRNLDRTPELNSLRARITELERSQRDMRQGTSSATSRTPSRGLSQVSRENAALKTSIRTLEAKVATGEQSATQLRRDISSLRLKVSNLQSAVDRLR